MIQVVCSFWNKVPVVVVGSGRFILSFYLLFYVLLTCSSLLLSVRAGST